MHATVKLRELSKSAGRKSVCGITIPEELIEETGWELGDTIKIDTHRRVSRQKSVILILKRLQ